MEESEWWLERGTTINCGIKDSWKIPKVKSCDVLPVGWPLESQAIIWSKPIQLDYNPRKSLFKKFKSLKPTQWEEMVQKNSWMNRKVSHKDGWKEIADAWKPIVDKESKLFSFRIVNKCWEDAILIEIVKDWIPVRAFVSGDSNLVNHPPHGRKVISLNSKTAVWKPVSLN
jgi:hypothetical protein